MEGSLVIMLFASVFFNILLALLYWKAKELISIQDENIDRLTRTLVRNLRPSEEEQEEVDTWERFFN